MQVLKYSTMVGALVVAGFWLPPVQREDAAPFWMGEADMQASCTGAAPAHVDRGLAWLYGFGHDEALRAFERAAEEDPGCGLAWWGQALAHAGLPLNEDGPPLTAVLAGGAAARRAAAAGGATPREAALIDAVMALYDERAGATAALRRRAFAEAMDGVRRAWQDDDAAVLLSAIAWLGVVDFTGASRQRAAALIEERFGTSPGRAGAALILVAAFDTPAEADRGLAAADGHPWEEAPTPTARHLPSHLHAHLGLWDRMAAVNEAAWELSRETAGGDAGAHAIEWWHYAELQRGRYRRAGDVAAVAAGEGRLPAETRVIVAVRDALERRDWEAAQGLAGREDLPLRSQAAVLFARGLAGARLAWPGGQPDRMAEARAAAASLDAIAGRWGRTSDVELWRLGILAAVAASQEERNELALYLTHLLDLDLVLASARRHELPLLPAAELAGDLWIQVDRYRDAQREYRRALATHPRRARSLYGLASASFMRGEEDAAREAWTAFLETWRDADSDRHELSEAREALAREAR